MAKKNQSTSYWEYRAKKEREWQEQQLKNDAQFNKLVQGHFDETIASINKDIDAEFSRLAVRNKSTVEEARKAVSQSDIKAYQVEAKKVIAEANRMRAAQKHPTYNDWSSEVNERMRIYNATMRINRLEYLKSQIGLSMVQAGYQIDDDLQAKIAKDYTDELKRQASILSMTMKDSLWTSKEVQQQIMAQTNSATFSQRLWQNQDALKARLDAVLSTGIIEGSNPREMAAKLKDLVSTTVTNSRYVVERIARTESARVQHAAQIKSIKDNGYRYVKWHAEPGACKYCREIADNDEEGLGIGVFEIDDCPNIPVHPNCRCSISAHWVEGKNNWADNTPESAKEKLRMNLQHFGRKPSLTTNVKVIQERYDKAVQDYKKQTGVDVVALMKAGKFVDKDKHQYDDPKSKFIKYLMVQNGYDSLPKPVDKFTGQVVYRGVHDSNGKTADQFVDDLKHKPMVISGGYSSSKGRGYYFSEVEGQAAMHSRYGPNGKVTQWDIADDAKILNVDEALKINQQVENLVVKNNVMDRNYDIVGILGGYDVIKEDATINVLNGGVIEWQKYTR